MHEAAQTFNASPKGFTKLDAHYWVNILTLLFICHHFFVVFLFCPPTFLCFGQCGFRNQPTESTASFSISWLIDISSSQRCFLLQIFPRMYQNGLYCHILEKVQLAHSKSCFLTQLCRCPYSWNNV